MNNCRKSNKKRKNFVKIFPSEKRTSYNSQKNEYSVGECNDINDTYILEGKAIIPNKKNRVFYNRTQIFNRDLSIVLIKTLELYVRNKNKNSDNVCFRGFNILELLGASGIRSIRYAKELGSCVNHITVNDIDAYAYRQIRKNFKLNKIDKDKFTVLCNDANIATNILNIPNVSQKKRKCKNLEIGFCYKRRLCDFNSYFREAFRFLKVASTYSSGRTNSFSSNLNNGINGGDVEQNSDGEVLSDDELEVKCEEAMKLATERCALLNRNSTEEKEKEKSGEMNGKERTYNKNNDMEEEEIVKTAGVVEKYLFDIIDIDPYGSSINFLDNCLKYGRSNFFIFVTNTDMRILNGKYPEVSFYKYNNMLFSKKGIYNYEFSIRALLYKIKTIASKYKKSVIPFFSLNVDFYIRLLLQVVDDPMQTKDLCIQSGMVYQCANCCSFHVLPLAQKKDVPTGGKKEKNKRRNRRRNTEQNIEESDGSVFSGNSNRESDRKQEEMEEGNIQHKKTESTENVENLETAYCTEAEENASDFKKLNNEKIRGTVEQANHVENAEKEKKEEKAEHGENEKTTGAKGTKGTAQIPFFKYRCNVLNVPKSCEECNGPFLIGGPIYIGKLHNKEFLQMCSEVLENSEKYGLEHILSKNRVAIQCRCLMQELDYPLYYNLVHLFKLFRICAFPRHLMTNALINLNYQVSYFHRDPSSIKTNAPNHIFMDVFRTVIFKLNSKKRKSREGEDIVKSLVLDHALDIDVETNVTNDNEDVEMKPTNGMTDTSTKANGNNNDSCINKNTENITINNEIIKKYTIDTIEDEKLKQKLLTYTFFKKGSSIDNVSFREKVKNEKVKLFTLENPEPYWGPQKKHCSKA